MTKTSAQELQASISVLIMSLASSATVSMGLAPHPETGQKTQDLAVARFNIDLLLVMKEKTKGNLTAEENHFLDAVVADLQSHYLSQMKGKP